MSETGRKRPWLAALLALLYPGLGHLYLRSWIRSVLWFGLVGSAVVVVVPTSTIQPSEGIGTALAALWDALVGLELRNQLMLVAIVLTETLDAYVLAASNRGTATDGCPNCGRELDEDLEFCHWCSTPLE